MANWAVVIGIDRYWSEGAHLRGAVRDALAVREWLLDPFGGDVPADNLQLVLAPGPHSPPVDEALAAVPGTKANIIVAINNLIQLSGGKGERLYFFFAGHGLTTRVSNRDESALLATDFNSVNTDNSIALRSLWEYFETTQFDDQFLFVDACRNVPPWNEGAEFELGRWTLPRTRDPGVPPVQQFILYATSPKLKATEVREEPGAEHGAFTAALLDGLRGAGAAKAWSWQRGCYEVRWERLADYVKQRVEREALKVAETPEGALLQIPQDSGSRGVANRERDVAIASFPREAFQKERLEVRLDPDSAYPAADVRVLDAVGDVVAGQVGFAGTSVVFFLSPGTYALRASAPELGQGRATAPVELYEPPTEPPTIALSLDEAAPAAPAAGEDGTAPAPATEPVAAAPAVARGLGSDAGCRLELAAPDPLSIVEVKDETGHVLEVGRVRPRVELPPGFYTVRHVGPEGAAHQATVAVGTDAGEERVELVASPPAAVTRELAESMGGRVGAANTIELPGCEPAAWARTSTLVALALGKALGGEAGAAALDLAPGIALAELPPDKPAGEAPCGIALYVVSDVTPLGEEALAVRVWPAGKPVPEQAVELRQVSDRLGELAVARKAGPYWLSIERPGHHPMVFPLTVLPGRLATVVLQITGAVRLFQYQPPVAGGPAAAPDVLRRVEYLQRLLLAGRLDGTRELALELAAGDDPFVGCLCGYVLLRLGLWEELNAVADRVAETSPQLADAFVLRGEYAGATGGPAARQAFAEAVGTGVPLFGEGLTRLLEGLRAHGLQHPREAIVRYVFQHHMRGSMWSVFTPRRFEPGTRLITAADTGHEA
ncbi:MAG TPA: caspase family protein [Gaiellaceae bacterium]|nr:caspase family protein [Gaiellaceae bacterium]